MCHAMREWVLLIISLIVVKYVMSSYFSEADIKNLYDSLHTHEQRILGILENPKLNDDLTLMENFEKYNEELAQLVSVIREDNATFNEARLFCDKGGPKFLKIKLDNNHLRKIFNWTEDHLQEMYYCIGATEVLWWELRQLDPKGIDFPIIDNFTKDEITYLHQIDKENRLNEFIEFTNPNDFQRTDKPKPVEKL